MIPSQKQLRLSSMAKKYIAYSAVIAIAITSFLLRLREISSVDLWYDEAFTGLSVRYGWKEILDVIREDGVHPPTYCLLLKIWTSLAGNTPFTLRFFSEICGVLTVMAAYLLSRKLFTKDSELIGLASALVVAISPFFVSYSVEARSYALVGLVGIIFVAGLMDLYRAILQGEKSIPKMVYALCLGGLLVSLHYYQVVIVVSGIAGLAVAWLLNCNRATARYFAYCVMTLFCGAFFLSGLVKTSILRQPAELDWIAPASIWNMPAAIYAYLFGVVRYAIGVPPLNSMKFGISPPFVGIVVFALLLALVITFFARNRCRFEAGAMVLLLSVSLVPICCVIMMSSIGLDAFVVRYLIVAGIMLVELVVTLSVFVLKKYAAFVLLAYFLLLGCLSKYPSHSHYVPLFNYLRSFRSNIVFVDPYDYVVARYYLEPESSFPAIL